MKKVSDMQNPVRTFGVITHYYFLKIFVNTVALY